MVRTGQGRKLDGLNRSRLEVRWFEQVKVGS